MAREPVIVSGRVAQPGQGDALRQLARSAPGRADARRDTAALLRSIRLQQSLTRSGPGSVKLGPSFAPRGIHARDARAVPSGRLGVGEDPPLPPSGEPEQTPATLTLAYCCGQEVRRNPILKVSFCEKCGKHGPFLIRTLSRFQTSIVGV